MKVLSAKINSSASYRKDWTVELKNKEKGRAERNTEQDGSVEQTQATSRENLSYYWRDRVDAVLW